MREAIKEVINGANLESLVHSVYGSTYEGGNQGGHQLYFNQEAIKGHQRAVWIKHLPFEKAIGKRSTRHQKRHHGARTR